MPKILVIDDEPNILKMVERSLSSDHYEIQSFSSPQKGIGALKRFNPHVVITDIKMKKMDGFEVLQKVKEFNPEVNVILITAYASLDTAIAALRGGAFDYLMKPFKIDELRVAVRRALSEKKILSYKTQQEDFHKQFIVVGTKMQEIMKIIQRVAKSESTILIIGESGTGKELVSRAIHYYSPHAHNPFVSINCAALPDALLESELFGHEKGSFTGAVNTKMGLLEYAQGGTVFLDEIGETSLNIQVKLLRALQEREIKRVGGLKDIPVDIRVIAATSRDLEKEVSNGRFREDLFYRLNVIPINLPPLRDRKEDIPKLVMHFVDYYNKKMEKQVILTPEGMDVFLQYNWPGNVRELENTIERIITLSESATLDKETVVRCWNQEKDKKSQSSSVSSALKRETEDLEKQLIMRTLQETEGNRKQAAKRLNISRQNLQYKLKKYDIITDDL